jgi:hypothetical protein
MSGRSGSSHPGEGRYPPEIRECAVRIVLETMEESGEPFGVITRVARQLGIWGGVAALPEVADTQYRPANRRSSCRVSRYF